MIISSGDEIASKEQPERLKEEERQLSHETIRPRATKLRATIKLHATIDRMKIQAQRSHGDRRRFDSFIDSADERLLARSEDKGGAIREHPYQRHNARPQ